MDSKKVLAIVHKNINVPGLLADILDEVLEPILDKVVADSTNKFDDMAKAAIYPILEKELKEGIVKVYAKLIEA